VLLAARCKYGTQKSRQKSPSGHHRTTLSGYIFATKACYLSFLRAAIKQCVLERVSLYRVIVTLMLCVKEQLYCRKIYLWRCWEGSCGPRRPRSQRRRFLAGTRARPLTRCRWRHRRWRSRATRRQSIADLAGRCPDLNMSIVSRQTGIMRADSERHSAPRNSVTGLQRLPRPRDPFTSPLQNTTMNWTGSSQFWICSELVHFSSSVLPVPMYCSRLLIINKNLLIYSLT